MIKWYQSKTIWFNVIMTILGIVTAFQGMVEFNEYSKIFLVILAVGNVILRIWFTETSVK